MSDVEIFNLIPSDFPVSFSPARGTISHGAGTIPPGPGPPVSVWFGSTRGYFFHFLLLSFPPELWDRGVACFPCQVAV